MQTKAVPPCITGQNMLHAECLCACALQRHVYVCGSLTNAKLQGIFVLADTCRSTAQLASLAPAVLDLQKVQMCRC